MSLEGIRPPLTLRPVLFSLFGKSCCYYCFYSLFHIINSLPYLHSLVLIILLSGDIESNPGPAVRFARSSCRVLAGNIRGLYANRLNLEVLSRNCDLLVSEIQTGFRNKNNVKDKGFSYSIPT
jgi:hypothetical protein